MQSLFDAWSECACRINNSFDEKAQPFAWHEVRERAIRCTVASRKGIVLNVSVI